MTEHYVPLFCGIVVPSEISTTADALGHFVIEHKLNSMLFALDRVLLASQEQTRAMKQ